MNGVLIRLKEMLQQLAPSERAIGEYILKEPQLTVQSSVKALAYRSGSSESAVIRLCKSMGFSGFSAFKVGLIQEMGTQNIATEFEDAMPGDALEKIVDSVCAANRLAVENTYKILDISRVEQAVEWLRQARRIECYGVGGSAEVAFDAYMKFMRVGRWASWYQDTHLQLTSAALLDERDVVLAVSYSGRTKELCDAAQVAHDNGAKVIAITKYGSAPLNFIADVSLYVSAPESDLRSASTCSRMGELTLVDILFTAFASKEYDTIRPKLTKTHEVASRHKLKN